MRAPCCCASARRTFDLSRPAVNIGCVICGTKLHAAMWPGEEAGELRALAAQKSAQADLREVGSFGDADVGVRGDQILFGRADIGTPFKQRRWESCRHLRWKLLFGQGSSPLDRPGIPSEQQTDLVFCLLDLLLQSWDRFRRGIHQLLALAQVEQRGNASALPRFESAAEIPAVCPACAGRCPVRSQVREA